MTYGHLTLKGSILIYLGFSIWKESQPSTGEGTKGALKFFIWQEPVISQRYTENQEEIARKIWNTQIGLKGDEKLQKRKIWVFYDDFIKKTKGSSKI